MLRTCVRSSRLSLYARTQRLTENAPYKGLWLVVKTTTNQLHSGKCRKAALTSSYPIPQNGNQGGMAVIRPSICLLPFWEQAKSVGQFGQLKKPDELTGGDSQIFACQLARCRSAEDAVLCPSDMMLCIISYWVLSGAPQAADSAAKLLRTPPHQDVEIEECLSETDTTQRTSRNQRRL